MTRHSAQKCRRNSWYLASASRHVSATSQPNALAMFSAYSSKSSDPDTVWSNTPQYLLVQLVLCSHSLLHGAKWYDHHDCNALGSNHLLIEGETGKFWTKISNPEFDWNKYCVTTWVESNFLAFTFSGTKMRIQVVHQLYARLHVCIEKNPGPACPVKINLSIQWVCKEIIGLFPKWRQLSGTNKSSIHAPFR